MSINIHWFPGHMQKALRLMQENLKLCDLVIYVLDSRAPFSCINPLFDEMFAGKKIIYVLNKSDLGVASQVKEWVSYLSSGGVAAVSVDSTASGSANLITKKARDLCFEKIEKYKAKGVKTSIRAMVVGVPNSGKSTLINNLCGAGKTMTGNRPGVTRGKQWVRVTDFFEVLDTPGTLYHKLTDERVARRLAFLGSIKDEVVDTNSLSCLLLEELNLLDNSIILSRYNTEFTVSGVETLKKIAAARGCLLKGGEPDIERAAVLVIEDFRKGRLGKITLESAEEYANAFKN